MKRTLFHWPLDPGSREVRLVLGEKRLAFVAAQLDFPADQGKLQQMNPSARPPVLREEEPGETRIICESLAIIAYLEETKTTHSLLPDTAMQRAEVRRLQSWFAEKFQSEVLGLILYERIEKPMLGLGSPDAAAMREGKRNLRQHLGYLQSLIAARNWLAGDMLSLADLAAMASLSCLDYFGDVPFEEFPIFKNWYVRLKSRPSFRPLLDDSFPGIAPAPQYSDLDF
ncbi:Glutathione S-transferase family protein [hydrothermal vent metagenome]|uniref:Glutathione S-transferase family protein n=1 Tax=hydrothermal vent metagenome TaxID=652676 RepID=A0A3B0SBC6_9ZZZZ